MLHSASGGCTLPSLNTLWLKAERERERGGGFMRFHSNTGGRKSIELTPLLILLIIISSAPSCRKTTTDKDIARANQDDEENLKTLREALHYNPAEVKKEEETLAKDSERLKPPRISDPTLQAEYDSYLAQIKKCFDLALQIKKAGSEDRFGDIPDLAVQGYVTADGVLVAINAKFEQLRSDTKNPPSLGRLKLYTAIVEQAAKLRGDPFLKVLYLIATTGTRQIRLTTFQIVAKEHSSEKAAKRPSGPVNLEYLLQKAYKEERDADLKPKMAEILNQRQIPLAAVKPEGQ